MSHSTAAPRHLTSVDDLTDAEVQVILARSEEWASGAAEPDGQVCGFSAATVFLTSSLRTRVGFSVACQRLGGHVVDIAEARHGVSMSADESFADTLRTITGMVDVVIARTPFALDATMLANARCPVINGGDTREHPSQALIDLSAITTFAGNPSELAIGICGDVSMRSVTSLLTLLSRMPPRRLSLASPVNRRGGTQELLRRFPVSASWTQTPDVADIDVLYLPGLPRGAGADAVDDEARGVYAFDQGLAEALPPSSTVLSPLPVIDEVAPGCRDDPRIRMFDQSDRAVWVRMALLEWALGASM